MKIKEIFIAVVAGLMANGIHELIMSLIRVS